MTRRARLVTITIGDYLAVLPPTGTCPKLGLSAADATRMRNVATHLTRTIRDAASSAGADFIDIGAVSRDHDVCAAMSWLNDRHPTGTFDAPLHPNADGMQAVADAISRSLDQRGTPSMR